MKVIIAGSRDITDYAFLSKVINESGFLITEVVSGGAQGVDRLGEQWATLNHIPIRQFKPDWSLGKRAGPLRNTKMAEYSDGLIALWDGASRGTYDMIWKAQRHNLKRYVKIYENQKGVQP